MPNLIVLDCRKLSEEHEVKLLLAIHEYMDQKTPSDVILPIYIRKEKGVIETQPIVLISNTTWQRHTKSNATINKLTISSRQMERKSS